MMRKLLPPFAAALALAGPFCFVPVADTDTGWHVAVGRLVLQGRFPRTNALSWAFGDHPWYATSWLYDAVCAALLRAFPGTLGLQLFTFALLALALFALAAACAREGSAWVVPAIAVLLQPRIVPRPHVASWALLAAALALGPLSTRARAFCVGLIALGGNLHAGAAFGAFVLGLECLEAFWRTRNRVELLLAFAAGAALVANPGFLFDARYLFAHLNVDDVVQLREFEPPRFFLRPAFHLLLPLTLFLAVLRRRQRPALLVAAAVFAALGLRALRMVSEAELVWAPTLAWGFAQIPRRALAPAAAGAALLAAFSLRLDRVVPHLRLAPVWDEHALPVRAARFLDENGIAGRGFNAFRDGGYLEAARAGVPAFIDGRVQAIPPQAWHALAEAERSSASFQEYLENLGCEWAIATRVRERLGGYRLMNGARWALLYWDDTSEVFVRRDVERFAGLRAQLEYRYFRPYGQIVGSVEHLTREQLPLLLREIDRFERTSPQDPFAALVRCGALTRLRDSSAQRACEGASALAPPAIEPLVVKARSLQPAP